MSLIFLLIGIYILYLLLRPAIRVWRAYSKMKKGDFDMFGDLFGQPGAQKRSSAYDRDGNRKGGWTRPGVKKKKIGDDVGEYVKFSEVTVETSTESQTSSGGHSYTATEQQIVDVEWEDIPDDRSK